MKHLINILFLVLASGTIVLFFYESPHFKLLLISIGIVFILVLSSGVIWLRANYFLHAVHNVKAPYVLLSFDDGPNPATTPKILQTLHEHGIKALFFVIGEKAEKHPELLLQMKAQGHLIGSHTYTHPPLFALFSFQRVWEELHNGNRAIEQIIGEKPTLFRPPIGYTNPIIARAVKKMGLSVVGWNKRSFDSVIKNPERLKMRALKLNEPGSIILLHDNLEQTEKMLNNYISEAKKNGTIFANETSINSLLK